MAKTPVISFVFRPGGIQKDNVYTNWAKLVDEMGKVDGRKILEFDDSLTSPCVVPPGTWQMRDVMWAGYGPRPGATRSMVVIQDGAVLEELRMIGGQITIDNQAHTTSPISDFVDGPSSAAANHVHIGLRDDCGNAQIFNSGAAPLFDLGTAGSQGRTVFFFVQNSLFGMRHNPTPNVPLPPPNALIKHGGNVDVTLNFIGQNQTANGLIATPGPAKARFGALSSSTQIGADNINRDGHRFSPVTRIQRRVQPVPPVRAARSMQELGPINLPNLLLRCNGNGLNGSGFTVTLPKIAGGFQFGTQDPTPLYTGGQEIIVAEIMGGANLKVAPFSGTPPDTIDGDTTPVQINPKQARTFASDGYNNWITIVGD